MLDITVAICTWNRAAILRETLCAVERLEVPTEATWEVLVVDNNSTDDTRSTILEFEASLPIRYYHESKQGIACAHNAVLRKATGSLIVWLDDDCRPARHHLCGYWRAAQQWPNAILFSGGIEPEFEVTPPPWIANNLDLLAPVYGRLIRSGASRRLEQQESVFSGNMATRESIKAYSFDESLGRSHGARLGGEEIDLFMRVQSDGAEAVWVEGVVVQHYISKTAISERYIFDSFYAEGRLNIKLYGHQPVATLFGYPRWALRRLGEARVAQLITGCWSRGRQWLMAFRTVAEMKGVLAELRSTSRQQAMK